MPRNPTKSTAEIDYASSEAAKGAAIGAAKWGLITGFLGFAGYFLSPIYRSLTVQFKVYIQTSGMIFGGMIGGDRRLREYEVKARLEKKRRNDEAIWKKWEGLVEGEEKKQIQEEKGKR